MLPSETMIWQPEFTDKTLSRKPGAVQVNGVEVALEYTAERGIALLKQNPELYWQILAEAASIAQGKEQQKQDTIKKP
ncbi:hypothetical protein MOO14_18710, partial [Escherichia coli]|nr:hypothetical protein [Escherichia coli]